MVLSFFDMLQLLSLAHLPAKFLKAVAAIDGLTND